MAKLNFIKEFNTKFMNTFFFIKERVSDPWLACRPVCWGFDDDDEGPPPLKDKLLLECILWSSNGAREEGVIDLSRYIIKLDIPEQGFYNTQYSVVYLHRKYAKQWKRALAPSNSGVYGINTGHSEVLPTPDILQVCESVISNKLHDVYSAIKEVEIGNKLASAFAPHYCIGLSSVIKNVPCVYFKDAIIGFVDRVGEEYVIKIPESGRHFKEDLIQYIRVENI